MSRRHFLNFFKLIPSMFFFAPAPRAPKKQMGHVSGQLSPEGYAILAVPYPIPFGGEPFFYACPTGQGSFFVERFEANGLTPSVASVAVKGEPHAQVKFTWEAFTE